MLTNGVNCDLLSAMKLSAVLQHFGNSKAELARALGVTRQALTSWPKDGIPEKQALRLKYEILPGMGVDPETLRKVKGKAA